VSPERIVFQAKWDFPPPACKRRYFLNGREIAVEELGKIPRRNLFRYSGLFM
jgi:PP-loop superfamily ATP-utilizing enzyme